MRRMSGFLLAFGAVLALWARSSANVAAAPPDAKGEEPNLTFRAVSRPESVAPGGAGVVVVTGTVRKTVHVYADKLKVMPKAVDGVTYGAPKVVTPTSDYRDPAFPDEPPEKVWLDKIEIEIPFTVGEQALFPLKVGADVKWSCCDEGQCYAPETTKSPATAELAPPSGWVRPAGAPAPEPAAGPAVPATPAEPPKPQSGDSPPGPSVPPVPPVTPAPPGSPEPTKPGELTLSDRAASVVVRATAKEVTVVFTPEQGYHLYAPGAKEGDPLWVKGVEMPGHRFRDPIHDALLEPEVRAPFTIRLPYEVTEASTGAPVVVVHWQGCTDGGNCDVPSEKRLELRTADGALSVVEVERPGKTAKPAPSPAPVPGPGPAAVAATPPAPSASPAPTASGGGGVHACGVVSPLPARGLLFPEIGTAQPETLVDKYFREWGWFFLLPIFLIGAGLAFTPCVLPLIPITVSLIGGKNVAELSKGRLSFLLGCYVAGLALTFGVAGVAAALTGGSMAAAFQSPVALWVIAGVFVVLGLGMFGVIELQPPQFLQRIQGEAKGGSPLGAFALGGLGAVIASPCTGPMIAAMLLFIATSGNVLLGFLMFLAMGLGMGAVLFAAGSLNMLARPGPWMVWVRYVFGVVIMGIALYYLANAGKISPRVLFLLGGALALGSAVLVQRHLIRKEGDEPGLATRRGAIVGVKLAVATLVVAMLTRPPSIDHELTWVKVKSREQLCAEVLKAKAADQAIVVDFWAEWCNYCKKYDVVIAQDARVRTGFERLARLQVDLTDENRPWEEGVREALGAPPGQQPYLVFLTSKGEIVRDFKTEGAPVRGESEARFEKILKALGALK